MSFSNRFDVFETSNRAVRGQQHAHQRHWCGAYILRQWVNKYMILGINASDCSSKGSGLGPSVPAVRNFGPLRIPAVMHDYSAAVDPVVCCAVPCHGISSRSTHHQENTRHSRAAQQHVATPVCRRIKDTS